MATRENNDGSSRVPMPSDSQPQSQKQKSHDLEDPMPSDSQPQSQKQKSHDLEDTSTRPKRTKENKILIAAVIILAILTITLASILIYKTYFWKEVNGKEENASEVNMFGKEENGKEENANEVNMFNANKVNAHVPCEDAMPGIYILTKGLDLKFLDLGYLVEATRNPVIALTCAEGTKRVFNGKSFDFPKELAAYSPMPAGACKDDMKIVQTSQSLQKTFSTNVEVGGGYGPVAGSASVSYKTKKNMIEKSKSQYIFNECRQDSVEVFLRRPSALTVSKDFEAEVKELPTEYDDAKYHKVIKDYGTHFVSSGMLGGRFTFVLRAQKDEYSSSSSTEWKASLKLAMNFAMGSANAEASATDSVKATAHKLSQSASQDSKYVGGQANIKKNQFEDWQPTVSEQPVLISVKLTPIYELIKEGTAQRKNLRHKFAEYLSVGEKPAEFDPLGYNKRCEKDEDCLGTLTCDHEKPTKIGSRIWGEIPCGYSKNAICNVNLQCECLPTRDSLFSLSKIQCLANCNSFDNKKYVKYYGKGFLDPQLEDDRKITDTTPEKCAEECSNMGHPVCPAPYYTKNGQKYMDVQNHLFEEAKACTSDSGKKRCGSFIFDRNENYCQLLPYYRPAKEKKNVLLFEEHRDYYKPVCD